MKFPKLAPGGRSASGWARCAVLGLALVVSGTSAPAQNTPPDASADQQTIRMLLQRIERLEARVAQLESAHGQSVPAPVASVPAAFATRPPSGPAAGPAEAPPVPASAQAQSSESETDEHLEPERMDMSKTLLRMRGFGDISFRGTDQQGQTNGFSLGQLNLFVTSDISEKFKFLSEIVFESGPDNFYNVPGGNRNNFSVDVERYLLQYSYNDYFNLAVGRYHTAIGFYNTAYHHSTWFQTTTGRPLLFEFEDRGGILPIHNVGVSASGRIPSGPLGCTTWPRLATGGRRVRPSPRNRCRTKWTRTTTRHSTWHCSRVPKPSAGCSSGSRDTTTD